MSYKVYISEIGSIIRKWALLQKIQAQKKKTQFEKGQLDGYREIIGFMQKEAKKLKIPFEDLGLENFDPDTDLMIGEK